MRPKVVIFTLVAAFALLGIIAVLKGVSGKHDGDSGGQASGPSANSGTPNGATNRTAQANANASNTVALSDQLRAVVIRKETDAIRELQGEADGTNNPVIIAALLAKITHPEAEVRATALDAIKQLNDTNALPGLEQAEQLITDPREKVAVLDTIDYLKMPSITPDVQPADLNTNAPVIPTNPNATAAPRMPPESQMNPKFLHKARNRQAAPNNGAPAPAPQPQ